METIKLSRTRQRVVDGSSKQLNKVSPADVQDLRKKTMALLSDYIVIRDTFINGGYFRQEHPIVRSFAKLNLDNGKELVRGAVKVAKLMKEVIRREEGENVISSAIRKQGKGKNHSLGSRESELEVFKAELKNFNKGRESLEKLRKYLEDNHRNTSDPYQSYSMYLHLKLVGNELLP